MAASEELKSIRKKLHASYASSWVHLYIFGDELAEKNGYDVDGLEAVYFYLFDKRGLLPEYTSALNLDALRLLLQMELKGWTIPSRFKKEDEKYTNIAALRQSQADLDHFTENYGDHLIEREKYDSDMDARDALELYLCRRHNYRPNEVSVWSLETIAKLLDDEIASWSNAQSRD